jgi:DGQHR domain-containing protein
MKFEDVHKDYFDALDGAFAFVTERENYDSQITVKDFATSLVVKFFKKENILIGKVSDDRVKAQKDFLLYPKMKKIQLNLVFPKANKTELRLYISSSKGFKPKANDVWFIYLNKNNELVIGTLKHDDWDKINVNVEKYTSDSLKTSFNGIDVFTQPMKVRDVLTLSYVAVRGRDPEDGAVQRILNAGRVKQIRDYILLNKKFFNTFILNWTNANNPIVFKSGKISIPIIPNAAQVLDGQHRLAGLDEAIKIDKSVGDQIILVSFTISLETRDAAEIFLNINTEQKPVPKSLIYDLFGVVENDKEHAVNRALDIATELNDNESSAYYKLVKFPGSPVGIGIVDLSTFVSTLKNYLTSDGVFSNYNITDLGRQKQIFLNYFSAIKFFYDKKDFWNVKTKNPFLNSSGVVASIEFLMDFLLLKCSDKKSFSVQTFKEFLNLDKNELLTQASVKGTDGKSARATIKSYLEENLLADAPEQEEYEF